MIGRTTCVRERGGPTVSSRVQSQEHVKTDLDPADLAHTVATGDTAAEKTDAGGAVAGDAGVLSLGRSWPHCLRVGAGLDHGSCQTDEGVTTVPASTGDVDVGFL